MKEDVRKWLKRTLQDQLVIKMLKTSHLTKIQLETLLIDILAEEMAGKQISYNDKTKLRLTSKKITRGAFNQTLMQARRNVIHSIYTLFLLGYLGILETPRLSPYIEVSNRLKTYIEEYVQVWDAVGKDDDNKGRIDSIRLLREEIFNIIGDLSAPKSLSKKA